MMTFTHNNQSDRPLFEPIQDIVFLTLPPFKDTCCFILEKYIFNKNVRCHFAFDREMLHDILPHISSHNSILISLGTSVIVRKEELYAFTLAYNCHSGPPEYPGSYPYHFAIFEEATHYGATLHEMDEFIDHGPIIYMDRFVIESSDTPMTLLEKSLHHLFVMMETLFELIFCQHRVPFPIAELWGQRMMTEKKFNALCQLHTAMTKDEFEKSYLSFQNGAEVNNLVLHFYGHRFRYEGPVEGDVVDLFSERKDMDEHRFSDLDPINDSMKKVG